jgi:hypothetical protein
MRSIPIPIETVFTKTIKMRAEPTLSALLKPPPSCALSGLTCQLAWAEIGSRTDAHPPKIWQIAEDLGPYLQKLGKGLFGCPIPELGLGSCTPPYKYQDLSEAMSGDPSGVCTDLDNANAARMTNTFSINSKDESTGAPSLT